MRLKLCLIGFFMIVFILQVNSQAPYLLRSTLSIGGVSVTVSADGHKVAIQQSIGQSSVTGAYRSNNLELRQGFIQPVMTFKSYLEYEDKNVIVWPNPFLSEVYVKLNKELSGNVDLTITDVAGRAVFAERIPADKTIMVNLGSLSSGIYILKIRKDNLLFNCKIIKD